MDARTDVTPGRVPQVTLGVRMQLALRSSKHSIEAIAAELGVTRGTVSRWMNDHAIPRLVYIRLWAQITGVDYDWLLTGRDPGRRQNVAA